MTVADLWSLCLRRWPVLLVGLLLTGAALVGVRSATGVYWAQSYVAFLAPQTTKAPNSLQGSSDGLVALAGVVEREFNNGHEDPATASSQVTLVDEGIKDGSSVELPNAGGQWTYYFDQAVLNVQVSGPTYADVEASMGSTVAHLRAVLDQRQDAAGVAQVNKVTLDVSPATANVQYAGVAHTQAEITVIAVGIALTIASAVIVDGLALRRRRPASPTGPDMVLKV